jgi:hypothetical protein
MHHIVLLIKMQVDLGEELRAGLIFYATSPYTGENMVSLNDDQSKIAKLLQTFQRVSFIFLWQLCVKY